MEKKVKVMSEEKKKMMERAGTYKTHQNRISSKLEGLKQAFGKLRDKLENG